MPKSNLKAALHALVRAHTPKIDSEQAARQLTDLISKRIRALQEAGHSREEILRVVAKEVAGEGDDGPEGGPPPELDVSVLIWVPEEQAYLPYHRFAREYPDRIESSSDPLVRIISSIQRS